MRSLVTGALMLAVTIAHGAEPGGTVAPTVEYATEQKLNVTWPGEVDREAYVVLEFDVPASGKPANIRLVDDGFHEKRFVDAATYALKNSTWKPQRVNGKAVDSYGLRKAFNFSIQELEKGVTEEFRKEALTVVSLVKKGDYAGGEFHAQWMLAEKVKLNYEYAMLEAQLGQTYAGLGKLDDASRKLARATARTRGTPDFLQLLDAPPPNKASNYLLPKALVVQLLDLRARVLAAQGLLLEAMQVYYELAGLETLKADDPRSTLAAQWAAKIRGQEELRAKFQLASGGWRQFLSRRRFMLSNVRNGGINTMFLSCAGGKKDLAYVPGEEWTVPEGWGLCTVILQAEPGTQLEFVELPDA